MEIGSNLNCILIASQQESSIAKHILQILQLIIKIRRNKTSFRICRQPNI